MYLVEALNTRKFCQRAIDEIGKIHAYSRSQREVHHGFVNEHALYHEKIHGSHSSKASHPTAHAGSRTEYHKYSDSMRTFDILMKNPQFESYLCMLRKAKDMRSKYESKRYEIRLRNYYRCMQLRDEQASTYARVTAITALRDAEVNLRCFDCLSPEEQNEVEEVWKPNESFLGKKTRVIYDRIKEALLAAVNVHKKSDPKEWDYSWEKAELTHSWKGDWWNVIGIDDSLSIADKTMEVLRRKMRGGGKRPKLGDHFELRLPAVTKHEMGWYRCVKRLHTNDSDDRNGDIIQVANMYFVDAISNITSNVVSFNQLFYSFQLFLWI
ncbi:unnamed protein product [Anisakis simplex]|uniref:Ig-like domain-containing protein n=1 Tax=Anisakis simplex TaxID=6269 RepID=A0A0M3KC80_ANISI|nr:unnamed protein product [Anisakis simplex]